jgi:transcriptional regulator with XRE-family HTH domain
MTLKDIAIRFGRRLREVRKEKGFSQDNLALAAEIDRSYLGRVERGEVNITLEKAYQLASILKCDIKEQLP